MENRIDFSRINISLRNIRKVSSSNLSYSPTISKQYFPDSFSSSILDPLEDFDHKERLDPSNIGIQADRYVHGYDESISTMFALEGELVFVSSACIMTDDEEYKYNLSVKPFFVTSMRKYQSHQDEDTVIYSENPAEARIRKIVSEKISSITESVSDKSVVFIDGPLIAGNVSSYLIRMDEELREKDIIPLYFVKNSNSRLILDNISYLSENYNSDFHWANDTLPVGHRSSFFRYYDQYNKRNTKVFSYIKPFIGFPQRVEMHSETYYQYQEIMNDLFDLIFYYYIAQSSKNPQVRPIAIAEKYAREGIRILNLPQLVRSLGFHPSLNQVRFR